MHPEINYIDWKGELAYFDYEIGFFGSCMGVILSRRGEKDHHIIVTLVVEDDGNWGVSRNHSGPSSFWLPEMIAKLQEAQTWMEKNAKKDGQYGFKFK